MTADDAFRMQAIEREPAWLTAAVDQDIQRIKAALFFAREELPPADVLMLMLKEHETTGMSEPEFMEWNEQCDNCGKRFPHGDGLLYCHVVRSFNERTRACITFAACLDCLAQP